MNRNRSSLNIVYFIVSKALNFKVMGLKDKKGETSKASPDHTHSGDESKPEETSNPHITREESIGFFYALILSLLNFIKPWYEYIKGYHPLVENVFSILEQLEKKVEDFIKKYDSIFDIKLEDLMQFLKSLYEDVKSYFTGDNTPMKLSFRLWHKTRLAILESLEYVERIQEYVVPTMEGVEPLFKMDKRETYSIRLVCFYMNMNLIHRVIYSTASYLSELLTSCCCSSKSKVVPVRIAESKEDIATN